MSTKKYDLVFFIGRQQPTTNAHVETIVEAFDHGDQVAVLIGSVDIARDVKNPFTYNERCDMVNQAVADAMAYNVHHSRSANWFNFFHVFGVLDDLYNNNLWASQVQNIVYNLTHGDKDAKVALIGHDKDASTFYLDMFPEWDFIETGSHGDINATDIRKILFEEIKTHGFTPEIEAALLEKLPEATVSFLRLFTTTRDIEIFENLIGEYDYLEFDRKRWAPAPFAHKDVTVDAAIFQSGHVLVGERGKYPGKGLYAMPGGHLEIWEEIIDGMLRELLEETKIKVSRNTLIGSIFHTKVFSHPKRSLRGRIITHAYGIQLRNGPLPKVKGSDDLRRAWWMPIAEFKRSRHLFFEDHWSIISYFLDRCEN